MKSFKRSQLVTMGAFVGIGLFNPMTVNVLDEYFKLVYYGLFVVCSVWAGAFLLYNAFKPQKTSLKTRKMNRKEGLEYEEV